eukprot:7501533-Pyramimonas_sp.AAC.1
MHRAASPMHHRETGDAPATSKISRRRLHVDSRALRRAALPMQRRRGAILEPHLGRLIWEAPRTHLLGPTNWSLSTSESSMAPHGGLPCHLAGSRESLIDASQRQATLVDAESKLTSAKRR